MPVAAMPVAVPVAGRPVFPVSGALVGALPQLALPVNKRAGPSGMGIS